MQAIVIFILAISALFSSLKISAQKKREDVSPPLLVALWCCTWAALITVFLDALRIIMTNIAALK